MDPLIPSCDRCGHVGVALSGMHPDDDGLVRWTLYGCGHMRTEIELETLDAVDEPHAEDPDVQLLDPPTRADADRS
jgi:hypothetical protein